MILSESDAVYAANKFIDYYTQFNRIDDYLRHIKEDRGEQRSGYLPGFGADSEMFDEFNIHPNDMNFKIYVVDTNPKTNSKYNQWLYSEILNLTASSIFNDKAKAIQVCVNRFDDETKQAFLELYDKVDADFQMPVENDRIYVIDGGANI